MYLCVKIIRDEKRKGYIFFKKNNLHKFQIEGWYFDLKLHYLKWVVLIQKKIRGEFNIHQWRNTKYRYNNIWEYDNIPFIYYTFWKLYPFIVQVRQNVEISHTPINCPPIILTTSISTP